jgi:hypothetical protein
VIENNCHKLPPSLCGRRRRFQPALPRRRALDVYVYATIAALANAAPGSDLEGYRDELVRLIRMADVLGAVSQR